MKTILHLRMALLDQCKKKVKSVMMLLKKKDQKQILGILSQHEQTMNYFQARLESLQKTLKKLSGENLQQYNKYLNMMQKKHGYQHEDLSIFDKTLNPI